MAPVDNDEEDLLPWCGCVGPSREEQEDESVPSVWSNVVVSNTRAAVAATGGGERPVERPSNTSATTEAIAVEKEEMGEDGSSAARVVETQSDGGEDKSPTIWNASYFTQVETGSRPQERNRRRSLLRQWASTATLLRKYKLGDVLGTGADAKVVRAVRRGDGKVFAIKIMDLKKAREGASSFDGSPGASPTRLALQARAARMRRELEIHFKLPQHPHVVPCFEVFSGARRSHLVLGICSGGTLLECVCGETRLLLEPGAARIARQVLEAIRFLHMHGVVHRDIKLENLLLRDEAVDADDVHVQLADFGSARYLRQRSLQRTPTAHVGTLAYMAPEQHTGGTVDAALDLWSFGIVLAALVTGRHPLRDVPREDWHTEMQRDRLPDGASEGAAAPWAVIPDARDLARKVLRLEPSDRITAAKALKHKWILQHDARKQPPPPPPEKPKEDPRTPKEERPRRPSMMQDVRSRLRRRSWGFQRALHGRRRRASAPPATHQPLPASLIADAMPPPKEEEEEEEEERESRDKVLKLPRVLAGLREVRRTRLQKALLVVVAMRAQDSEVRQALSLFEKISSNREYLTRSDVEDALLANDGVGIRAADELCEAFEGLSLDGSGKVTVAEFVAGALSLRRRSRLLVAMPVLAELDPNGVGRVQKKALADALHLAAAAAPTPRDSTGLPISSTLPSDDDITALVDSFADQDSLSYDQVLDFLFEECRRDDPPTNTT
ncbi:hypothetical protein CTAYLR_004133 [Chrysophaeum taylorii]|uniref:Uncharacterized protein n=1 Tax=Chrysophaeum taylorii TaxID=2483200 RepID=A0AAD7UL56_9STRA|nr:hypothetical protein CTAYLR_004133 [Chrysophaeum taylorii]